MKYKINFIMVIVFLMFFKLINAQEKKTKDFKTVGLQIGIKNSILDSISSTLKTNSSLASAIMKDSSLSQKNKKERLRLLFSEQKNIMGRFLTPEQLRTYQQYEDNKPKNRDPKLYKIDE